MVKVTDAASVRTPSTRTVKVSFGVSPRSNPRGILGCRLPHYRVVDVGVAGHPAQGGGAGGRGPEGGVADSPAEGHVALHGVGDGGVGGRIGRGWYEPGWLDEL